MDLTLGTTYLPSKASAEIFSLTSRGSQRFPQI